MLLVLSLKTCLWKIRVEMYIIKGVSFYTSLIFQRKLLASTEHEEFCRMLKDNLIKWCCLVSGWVTI